MQHHPHPIPLIRSLEITPQTPLMDALDLMNQTESDRTGKAASSTLLVVQDSQLVGTLNAQDVVRLVAAGSHQTMSVAEGMTRHPVTLTATEAQNCGTVFKLFEQHHLKDLPIVDEHNRVLGVITLASLTKVLNTRLQEHFVLEQCQLLVERQPQSEAHSSTKTSQSEQALIESEARFQEIAHTISQLFFVRSAATGQFLYISPAYETLWGRTCKSLYQDPDSWLDSVHPEDREQVLISLDNQFAETVTREYRIIRPNGEIRWISAQIELVRDEAGNPARFVGIAEDITDRKQAEEEIRQYELRLKQLTDNVPAVLYSVAKSDNFTQFEYISSAVHTVYELEPQQVLQDASLIYQQMQPEDYRAFTAAASQSAETLSPFQYEWQTTTPSGQRKWLQTNSQPERRPDGSTVWHGVIQDISDRKRAEVNLHEVYQRLRFHIENTPLAVIEWDCEFRVQRWSQQAETMFGWQAEEVVGKFWSDWRFVFEADLEAVKEAAGRLLNGSEPRNSSPSRNYTKAGTVVYCEWYNSALLDDEGNVVSILSMAQNVTERKQVEQKLRDREQFLRSIYDGVEPIFVVDVTPACDFRYVSWNPSAANFMKLKAEEIKDKTFEEIFEPELAALARERFKLCLQAGTTIVCEDYLNGSGGTWWRHTLTPLRNEQGKIYRIVGIASNITERKRIEQERDRLLQRVEDHNQILETRVRERTAELEQTNEQLQQQISDRQSAEAQIRASKARLAEAQRIAHIGSWEFDVSTQKITWSTELFKIFAREPAQGEPTYSQLVQLIHPDDRELFQQAVEQAIATGQSYTLDDLKILRPDGSVRHTETRGEAIGDEGVIKLFGTAMDITKRKQAEALLNQKSERARLTMAIAQHIRQSLDLDEILATAVREVRQLLQADRVSVFRLCPDGFGRVVAEAISSGQPSILNEEFPDEVFPDECHEVYSQGRARIVPDVANDEVAYCIAKFLVEIGVKSKLSVPILQADKLWGVMTVHHCLEVPRSWQQWELELLEELALQLAIAIGQSELYQQLQSELSQKERSLAEKEVLLKEIHHRVKNNLQIISSLLWLQSQQNNGALNFKDSQSRVQTMALIHEQLYQSADLAQIDFEPYLQTLMRSLFRSYGVSGAIALDINVNAPPLTIDIALPCGLIVSELVSNALKYAFPARQSGKVRIDFRSDAALVLSVSDNGIGLPQDLDFRNSASLGLLVVCDLTEQLDGTIELNRTDGTTFKITFPHSCR